MIRHLSSMLDFEIERLQKETAVSLDCKAGCDFCCYETVVATVPEILALFYYVKTNFSEEKRKALRYRLDDYETRMARHREDDYYFEKIACPFLEDHLCTAYDARPLICRGRNSQEVNACEIWKDHPGEIPLFPVFEPQWQAHFAEQRGISYALRGKLQPGRLELGQCLKLLFDRPGLDAAILSGKAVFPTPKVTKKPLHFEKVNGNVSLKMPQDPVPEQVIELTQSGDFAEVDRIVQKDNVLHLIMSLYMPRMYASHDQVLEVRERFLRTLDRLREMTFDPRDALPALSRRNTVSIASHGLSAKPLMERHGEFLWQKIACPAFPELTSPLGKRKPGRFRVGYLSGNLNNNNGCKWALGWLKGHGEEFETFAFNCGGKPDIFSRIFASHADHYENLTGQLEGMAEYIRSLDLDAMIFTDVGTRIGDYYFAVLRLARVQCTAWGMPMTSGLPNMDYYLGSDLMEPENGQEEYTEKLVRLPNSGLVLSRPRGVIHPRPRSDYKLDEGFLPLMAQSLYKLAPMNDGLLRRIQERFGKPLAFVAFPEPADLEIFDERMRRQGIERFYLAKTDDIGFNRYLQMADVSYDLPAWSGGNTTIAALTMGLPHVTLPGEHMCGRHSYAFNKIANVDGLIAKDEDDYLDLIFNKERQREAMRGLEVDALYEDRAVSEALNAFLLGTAEGL